MPFLFLLFLFILFAITLSFGLLPLHKEKWKSWESFLVSFGAGFIFTTGILFLIPKALEHTSPLWILAGFLLLYFLEHFLLIHSCVGDDCPVHQMGWGAFLGLSIHAISAGMALGAGMGLSQTLGWITFFALAFHKIPESLSLSSILHHAGYSYARIRVFLLVFALALPLGAVGAFYSAQHFHHVIPILLAISAGTFLEIGSADLLPLVHKPGPMRARRLSGFLIGVAFPLVFSVFSFPMH